MTLTRKQKERFLHLWPKILLPRTRENFRNNIYRITVKERKEEMARNNINFIDPWAFIRVKNERKTLLASLNSIRSIIHKGVIAYNYTEDEVSDGSERIVEEFCKDNPRFIPFRYPYHVEPVNSPKYFDKSLQEKNALAGYYNAVLSKIPKNVWFLKIDVDQIYCPEILKHSFSLPQSIKDIVIYSRLNVIRVNNEVKVCSYIRPGDHWLVYNDNLKFINVIKKEGSLLNKKVLAFEQLKLGTKHNIPFYPECSTLHFQYEKIGRYYKEDTSNLKTLRDFLDSAPPDEFSDELISLLKYIKFFN